MPSKKSYPRYWQYVPEEYCCMVCYAPGDHLWHLSRSGLRYGLEGLDEKYAENHCNAREVFSHPNDPWGNKPLQIEYLLHILGEMREENHVLRKSLRSGR